MANKTRPFNYPVFGIFQPFLITSTCRPGLERYRFFLLISLGEPRDDER